MRLVNPFEELGIGRFFETLLPDFVLAFAFFTSICYAVLGKRFGQQRPAIAMSAVFGFALSVGLVWWEQANDFSIRNLGPVAIGFIVIVIAYVISLSIYLYHPQLQHSQPLDSDIRHDMSDLYGGQRLSNPLTRKIQNLHYETEILNNPQKTREGDEK